MSKPVDLIRKGFIYAGRRGVVREGVRFKLYLPTVMDEVWKSMVGRKVEVFVKIVDGDEEHEWRGGEGDDG